MTRWKDYASATKLQGQEKVIQLLECCDDDLRRDLTRLNGGSLTDKNESDVLANIKTLAVRDENTMVARVNLHNMVQDHDEPIRSFGARIRGQANVCKYVIKCNGCSTDISYMDHVLRDVLVKGVADHEIQLDLLSDKNQEMTLEEVYKSIEAKEAGKRSAITLQKSQAASLRSSYKKANAKPKYETKTIDVPPDIECQYCGTKGHGRRLPLKLRKNVCPAYGKTCKSCKRNNHTENVCRDKSKESKNSEDETFASLCIGSISDKHIEASLRTDFNGKRYCSLDHHLYDNLTDSWIKHSSRPQPFITLSVSAEKEDYRSFGLKLTSKTKKTDISVMADTGCQSCLASPSILNKLCLKEKDLIPVSMSMKAANNRGIKINGAAIVRISGEDKNGTTLETRQIVYISDETDKFFISKEACIDLGMISPNFPNVGEISTGTRNEKVSSVDTVDANACACPKRSLPPPKPTTLPSH